MTKLSELKPGDWVICDGGFTCTSPGAHEVFEDNGRLFITCLEGHHYLDGQCEEDDTLVGMVKE